MGVATPIDPEPGAAYVRADAFEESQMSEFEDRERGQEKKFQHDQEMEFRAQARRAKLTGLWAAGLMGMTGEPADAYAKSVILADLEEAGIEDLFRKIKGDLTAKNVAPSDHLIRVKMDELLEVARKQIQDGI